MCHTISLFRSKSQFDFQQYIFMKNLFLRNNFVKVPSSVVKWFEPSDFWPSHFNILITFNLQMVMFIMYCGKLYLCYKLILILNKIKCIEISHSVDWECKYVQFIAYNVLSKVAFRFARWLQLTQSTFKAQYATKHYLYTRLTRTT